MGELTKGKDGKRRERKRSKGFSHTLGDYGIGLPSALTVSQKRRPRRHKNNGGKERPSSTRRSASPKQQPSKEYQNSMPPTEEELALQAATTNQVTGAGPGTPTTDPPYVPPAGGADPMAPFYAGVDSFVGKTMASLQNAAKNMSGAIDKGTQRAIDALKKREDELDELEKKAALKERALNVAEFTIFGAIGLGALWAGTHIVLSVGDSRRAAKKAKLNPAGPPMSAMPV